MRTKYDNYIEDKTLPLGSPSREGTDKTSKNPNCKEKNIGDYCFQNNTKFNLEVRVDANYQNKYLTLQPGQKQCFFDLNSGAIHYCILAYTSVAYRYDYNVQGDLYVETCKEKTFIIK